MPSPLQTDQYRFQRLLRDVAQIKAEFSHYNFSRAQINRRDQLIFSKFKTLDIGSRYFSVDAGGNIQTAIDACDAVGGGTVYLNVGTYTLSADITVPGGVLLEGVSRDGVILDCNTSYAVKITGTDPYTTGNVTISNGDTTVVGGSTVWTDAMIGRYIYLDGRWYEITARADGTHITIASAYVGVDLSASAYAIATVNFTGALSKVTVQNATGSGVVVSYSMEPTVNDIIVTDCGTGIDLDFVQFPRIVATSNENGVNLDMNYVSGFKVDFCEFSDSTTGAGVVMTNCQNATFFDSEVSRNTGNGVSMTSCTGVTFISVSINDNGAKGVELISGNDYNQFDLITADGNTSDGIKLTATSDRNIVVEGTFTNNGGYGVNIAASTCDNNTIGLNSYVSNTSGILNDSGTNTVKDLHSAGTNLIASADTEEATGAFDSVTNTYTKLKEFQLAQQGTLTAKFDMKLVRIDPSLKPTTTVVASNCWLVAAGTSVGGGVNAGLNTTQRGTQDQTLVFDSNAVVGTGSQNLYIQGTVFPDSCGAIIASMAPNGTIAFDAQAKSSTTGTSLTYSHTTSGSNRMLIVASSSNGGDHITGVTYNAVAMTQVAKLAVGANYLYLHYLIAPATGANNVVVSSGSSVVLVSCAASYTGVLQSGFPDSSATTTTFSYEIDGRIYKNGVAVGTNRTQTASSADTSYTTYSEDISGLQPNDLLQLYGRNVDGQANATFRNFRLYANELEVTTATLN